MLEKRLQFYLQKRKDDQSIRQLTQKSQLLDFCSNDYLGFARSKELYKNIQQLSANYTQIGATGSRLLTGNYPLTEQIEQEIADFHKAEKGLLYNSGYDANVGFFSCLPRPNDLVLFDELSHASIWDGLKMSKATKVTFRHNDVQHLEELLKQHRDTAEVIFIAIESVYSMDGDLAPLKAICDLSQQYNANVVVDEAHGTGVIGKDGEGLAAHLGLEDQCFARIHTFGKSLGCHGAIILGNDLLRNYLINFSRSFIYTTALPFHSLITIKAAYDFLKKEQQRIRHLQDLIQFFQEKSQVLSWTILNSPSAIQGILIPNNKIAKTLAQYLEHQGFDIRAILYPTVPKGQERLRICLHSFNTKMNIERLVSLLNDI